MTEPVTTFTPILWVTLNADEQYQEYVRVREALAASASTHRRLAQKIEKLAERMNNCSRYKSYALGSIDSVSVNTVDDFADELRALLASSERPETK